VDTFFCDDGEARNITAHQTMGEAAQTLLDAGAGTVIIKRGEHGSLLYRQDWQHHQPAIHLGELVDSIGAGDTYDVGYIYGTLQSWSAEKCALFASIAAGFTVTGVGGSNTMPNLERILAEMESHQ
jgi:2-dehydro-3-deoxygluconokinase